MSRLSNGNIASDRIHAYLDYLRVKIVAYIPRNYREQAEYEHVSQVYNDVVRMYDAWRREELRYPPDIVTLDHLARMISNYISNFPADDNVLF